MAYVPVALLEEAIAFKCRLWLNDFLGLAEDASSDPAVKVGGTSRPVEYVRASDILSIQTSQTPALAVAVAEFTNWRRQGTQMWATCHVDVAVRFGCAAGVPTFDVGVGPRLYLEALGNLFDQPKCRDLGDGIRLNEPPVIDARLGDPLPTRNGDQFAVAVVTLAVDVPLFDRAELFFDAPSEVPPPGTPPRTPDTPLTILNLITSVEAMT